MGGAVVKLFAQFGTAEDLASALQPTTSQQPHWEHMELVGRLVELSGQSALSAAMGAVLSAQQQGEPVAWVSAGGPLFYPPDVAEGGIDLAALIVVRVRGSAAAARAGDKLLRSGAFGLVVLDFFNFIRVGTSGSSPSKRPGVSHARTAGAAHAQVPMALQARLAKLAQKHAAAVLVLTEKADHADSLSSLVSLRCTANRRWVAADRYICQVQVLKDKRRGPAWSDSEELRAPAGVG